MAQTIQRSFTGGELAPALRSRADLTKYSTGLALCKNFIIRSQGGAYSRPGLKFIGEVQDSTTQARLVSFSFNTEQTYILVFQNLTMRVIKDGGFVLAGAGPALYELATPYTTAQLSRLVVTQDADVMTICHPDHDPMLLSRTDHDVWTLVAEDYTSQVDAPVITSVVSSGVGGGDYNKRYAYVVTAVNEDGVESLASALASLTTLSLTSVKGVEINWTAVSEADYYRIYKNIGNGTSVYGWIGDSKNLEFTDFNVAPIVSDSPPEDRTPFDSVDNKPSTVGYYQQRKIFANTNNAPQTVFTTQTGIYDSLRTSVPARDDDAITFTIKGKQVNAIRHIVDVNALILLTAGAEGKVTEGQNEVLTPSTIGHRIQTYNGSSWVQPAVVDDTVIYVQDKGSRIRDLRYAFADDKYSGNDLSIMSEHLFEDQSILEMAYADEPYGILWAVRDDGALLGLTYQREHKVWAWHQHDTLGQFESIASISEDGRDAVYVVVKRTIDGNTVRYVERFEKRTVSAAEDTFCVDSGLTYDGAATTAISGLEHLALEDVDVLADGNVVEGLTVSAGGAITLPNEASKVTVGLTYLPAFETLDLDSASVAETLKAREVSISEVVIEVDKSRGGFAGPILDDGTAGEMFEIKPRFESDAYDEISLRTYKASVVIQDQWVFGGGIRIEQRDPLPLAILSVIPDVSIS